MDNTNDPSLIIKAQKEEIQSLRNQVLSLEYQVNSDVEKLVEKKRKLEHKLVGTFKRIKHLQDLLSKQEDLVTAAAKVVTAGVGQDALATAYYRYKNAKRLTEKAKAKAS
jgi:predicted nucleotidyltransferase